MTTRRSVSGVWSTWPIDRHKLLQLVVALVGSVGLFAALGYLMTDLLAPNPVTRFDVEIAERFVANRTPTGDELAHWGAMLADTAVKIGVTAVFAMIAFAVWRRWHETVYLAVTLIFEATVFIIVTTIIGRPRPDVLRLEDSPVNSSFPSGHVAAATVYGAFVVIVFWNTRATWARALAIVAYAFVVAAVAWARLYQGMHFLSDVVTGVVLGLWSLTVCLIVLGRPDGPIRELQGEHGADPVAQQGVDDDEVPREGPVADEAVAGRLNRS
ncbi:MAG TPA: phosphatase PAP2 family protein [Ilumatobacteraceae bacterium]|nr:phosphatase PAP2 family protein [Ilumatobacteraceae bacterium]